MTRYKLNAKNTEALREAGIRVPRILAAEEGAVWLGALRFFLTVEEFIHGRPPRSDNSEEIGCVMKTLARMHSTERSYPGLVTDEEPGIAQSFLETTIRRRVFSNLHDIQKEGGRPWPSDITDRIWEMIKRSANPAFSDRSFQFRLIHGDMRKKNVMISDRGHLIIDLVNVRYDLFGPEMIQATLFLATDDASQRASAWQAYFDCAGPERWEDFLVQSRLSLMIFGLRELSKGRALGVGEGKLIPDAKTIQSWVEQIDRLSPEIWGTQPGQTDFELLDRLLSESPEGSPH